MISKNTNILIFSLLIISIKWFFSYYYYDESLDVKIIFDSVTDGKYYFPFIKYLSDLNFNQTFDPEIINLNIIPLPIGGIFLHSLLFKIFGFSSFIVMEFICLFLFIYIFTNIFRYIFNFNDNLSILFAILIFLSPIIIKNTFLNDFQFIKIFSDNIYNFRVPRPMISNLYFFGFVLVLLKMNYKKFYKFKYFFFLGLLSGLSLSSFYYHFFIELTFFFIIIIKKFKKNIFFEIRNKIKYFILGILIFLIIITPFIFNLYLHEDEYTYRQCIFNINFIEKTELIKYFINKYLTIKFLFVILFLTFSCFYINKFFQTDKTISNTFFALFLASLISPILFILISNKSCVMYHFVNLIILNGIIYLLVIVSILIKNFSILKINKILYFFFSIILISTFIFGESKNYQNKTSNDEYSHFRNEFKIITKKIEKKYDIKNTSLLTFDTNLMIWSIMKDVKYLDLINSLFTPKKDFMIEEDLIASFKKLNLNDESFYSFIKNKKENWRYVNKDVAKFFFYKYQANSLITFNDSKNFKNDEYEWIKKSSPLLHQQSIIPREEMTRLLNKFKKFNSELIYPEIIILDKRDKFLKYESLNLINYCKEFNGDVFLMFVKKNKSLC